MKITVRPSVSAEAADPAQNNDLILKVERGGRFIENDNIRLSHQRPCKDDKLALPAGQGIKGMVCKIGDAEPVHHGQGEIQITSRWLGEQAQPFSASHHDHFDGCVFKSRIEQLGDECYLALADDVSLQRLHDPYQQLEQRRLARSVRAQYSRDPVPSEGTRSDHG